jgi:Uma2 family endonuclease
MSVHTSDVIEAALHLPAGGKLTLYGVGWDEYEQLLDRLGEATHVRTGYDNGRLEIMTPSARHENYKGLLHDLLLILSDELDQEIISYGSVTLKIERRRKGAEADDCFYIEHAALMADKDQLDLATDPPPDLVIEIDLTHDSSAKLAIYAGLGVPEIWRYDGDRFSLWRLTENEYAATPFSPAFPFLTAEHLAEFAVNCEARGRKAARDAFRAWIRATKPGAL